MTEHLEPRAEDRASDDEPSPPGEFWKYELSRGRRWAYTFFGIIFGLITLLSISDFSPPHTLGWLVLPLLGLGSFHFLRAGLDSSPRFEFTPDGFIDRSAMGGGALHLRWEEIRGIEWTTFGGQLEISVQDCAKVRRRAGWPRKFWMFLGSLWRKKTISIIPNHTGPNLVELKARLDDGLFEFERSQLRRGMEDQSTLPPGPDPSTKLRGAGAAGEIEGGSRKGRV